MAASLRCRHASGSYGEGQGTGERILNGGNSLSPERSFAAELSAFAAGREYEFAAITVAANQAFIPKSVEMLAVRKNLNAFRRLLDELGYSREDVATMTGARDPR